MFGDTVVQKPVFSVVQQVLTAAKVWPTSSTSKARNPSTPPAPLQLPRQQSSSQTGRRERDTAAPRRQGPTPSGCLRPPPRSSPQEGLPPPGNLPSPPPKVAPSHDPNSSASGGQFLYMRMRRDSRPRLQPNPCRRCLGVQPVPHRLPLGRPRTSQPSARGRRNPEPRTAPTARRGGSAPGCPQTPARSAPPRRPPARAHLRRGHEDPPAPAPPGRFSASPCRPRCGRARSLPRRSVGRRGRPPAPGLASPRLAGSLGAGWGPRPALPPREPGVRLTRWAANGRPRRRWAGPGAEGGGASAHRRGPPRLRCCAGRGKLLLGDAWELHLGGSRDLPST